MIGTEHAIVCISENLESRQTDSLGEIPALQRVLSNKVTNNEVTIYYGVIMPTSEDNYFSC